MSYMDDHKYDDIINLPHHVSTTHPQMSRQDRAAQFSPFAALTGYDAAVKETARLTDRRMELDEYEKTALDEKLKEALKYPEEEITITYFRPDERKAGGSYLTVRSKVRKIKEYERLIVLEDGTKIPLDDISEIEVEGVL
jgi:hypothetical protein